jgi:hypothetical protein
LCWPMGENSEAQSNALIDIEQLDGDPSANELSFKGIMSAPEVCTQILQSVADAAKDLLQPEKIFSFRVHSGRVVCTQKGEAPPPPPTRNDVYEKQRALYQLDQPEAKRTIDVAASLHSPATLREFLVAEHEAQELSRAYAEPVKDQQKPRNFRQVVATHGFVKMSEAPVLRPDPGRRRADLPSRRRTAEYWDARCRPAGPASDRPTIALTPGSCAAARTEAEAARRAAEDSDS